MIIGKCSICGGDVVMPQVWMGVLPPIPCCSDCGAIAENIGPVIPMRPVEENRKDSDE